jgi:hypothetical protein
VKYATDAEVHEREVRTLRRAYNASEDERHRWIESATASAPEGTP